MNNESVFALRFVVKNVAEMKKAVNEMNKNIGKMQKNANKASSSINKLNTGFGKAIKSIGKFALAYFALSKIINTAFTKANESIQLDMMAASAGVAAEKIGKLGKALKIYGGDAKSAGSAYASLTDIIGGATHGRGISEDVARVNAMFGIGFNYGNITQDQLMTNIAVAMKRLKGQGDQWGINQIASAYGLDSAMANFLAEQGANWSNKANREKLAKLSKSETKQLIESQDALNEEFANLSRNVIPALTTAMKSLNAVLEIITPYIKAIADWLGKKPEKPKTTTDEAGNTIYEAPIRRFGLFGPKTGSLQVIQQKEQEKGSISPIIKSDAFSMGGVFEKWKKISKDLEEEEKKQREIKAQYESVPRYEYTSNLFGGSELLIKLDASGKLKDLVSLKDAKLDGRAVPVSNSK